MQRLVDLNHERAAEEARGKIRWLRPDFQNPEGRSETQTTLDISAKEKPVKKTTAKVKKQPWPETLSDRFHAVRNALAEQAAPAEPATIAKLFTRARKNVVEEVLQTLVTVGQARETDDGRYVA